MYTDRVKIHTIAWMKLKVEHLKKTLGISAYKIILMKAGQEKKKWITDESLDMIKKRQKMMPSKRKHQKQMHKNKRLNEKCSEIDRDSLGIQIIKIKETTGQQMTGLIKSKVRKLIKDTWHSG